MSWTALDKAKYEAHKLWGKLKPPVMGERCHLCQGKGIRFEADGWFIPTWEECFYCRGTGHPPKDLPCGCQSVNGRITSAYHGHGHVSEGPE